MSITTAREMASESESEREMEMVLEMMEREREMERESRLAADWSLMSITRARETASPPPGSESESESERDMEMEMEMEMEIEMEREWERVVVIEMEMEIENWYANGEMEIELRKAAVTGDLSFFRQTRRGYREYLAVSLWKVTREGNSALHIAAKMGHYDLVEFLCRQNTQLPVLANNSGDYPLHCAARAGHLEIVRLLLSVATATAGIKNRMDISPLYLAAERASVDIVRVLLDTRRASYEGPKGQNALHAAVVRSLEITKLIVEQMPDLIKQGDDINKSTPLHYAASHADVEMVRFLLETNCSAAYLLDNGGFSAIHVAASIGHVNIVDELLRRCPGCMEMKDVSGRNFLHIAIEKKRVEVVRYVLQSMHLAELANLPDNNGNTALHLAVLSRSRYIIGLLSMHAEVYTSPMNSSGDTPLDLASSKIGNEIGHRMDKIRRDLIANGSRFRPQRLDLLPESPPRNQVEEINRYRAIVNTLAVVAVLIATCTFAAVFTLPGGYNNDNGTSLRASDPAFKVFLISDTAAMVSSIVATFILINTGSLDYDIRLYSLNAAKNLIWVALAGMTIAFGTNVLVVVKCEWLAVPVSVISCSVFFVALMATRRPAFDFLKKFKTKRFSKRSLVGNMDREHTELPVDMKIRQHLRQAHFPKFMTPR